MQEGVSILQWWKDVGCEGNGKHGAERPVHVDTKKNWCDSPRGIGAMGCRYEVRHFQRVQI